MKLTKEQLAQAMKEDGTLYTITRVARSIALEWEKNCPHKDHSHRRYTEEENLLFEFAGLLYEFRLEIEKRGQNRPETQGAKTI